MSQLSGLLLFAHGARDPAWAKPFEAVAQRVRQRDAGVEVALAFLEFMTPDLGTAGDALVAAGCRRVTVVPLFLGAGGHVRKDLPKLLEALRERHREVAWTLSPAIGEMDTVVDAMADAARALSRPGAQTVPEAPSQGAPGSP
jgi:sirohydrochlorin cobaltochelatase